MAQDRTAGFDMLVQLSENEVNDQIGTAFLAGTMFPSTLSVPVNQGGITGTVDLNFNTPVADFTRPRPQMGVTVPFVNSQLQINTPIALTLAPLGGTIVIVDTLSVESDGSNEIVRLDFVSDMPSVTVTFDSASQASLAPLLAVTGMTLDQLANLTAGMVITQLQTSIHHLDLTPPIPVVDDADPTTIYDIAVTTITDTSGPDRDCIAFGVRMSSDTVGNIGNITTNYIPSGSESLVMMSNNWLLGQVMRPKVANAMGLTTADFNAPLQLNHSVSAPGGQGTLTAFEAHIEGNRIRVTGQATDSGTGWSAVANFSFYIDLTLSNGALNVTATTPQVDTSVDLEWWVWVLSFGVGGWIGGIVGVIVAAIVLAIVQSVADGIVSNLISGAIGGAIGNVPSIPLGPIGGALALADVVLDDLELHGNIVKSLTVPVKSQGTELAAGGFTIDLDSGSIGNTVTADTDLIWDPVQGFTAHGTSGLTITGIPYLSLSPVQISGLPLMGNAVPAGQVPFSLPPLLWWFPYSEIVFGVRTSDGRLAKVSAYRSLMEGGALKMQWTTYDTPVPSLDISSRWSICERGEVSNFITPECAYCTASPVRQCCVFEAWPRLMRFPIDYQWTLCGTVLEPGDHTIDTANGPLSYSLNGRILCIETDMGQSVDCDLCVSAIDAGGRELFKRMPVVRSGIDTQCRKCVPYNTLVRTELVSVAAVNVRSTVFG